MRISQETKLHIGGGKAFVVYEHTVKVDGKPIGVVRSQRLEGRPRKKMVDVFIADDGERFDWLAVGNDVPKLREWIAARVEKAKVTP